MYLQVFTSAAFILTVHGQGLLDLDEGESCRVKGVDGICRLANDCTHVNFRQERPPICTFRSNLPVICCRPAPLRISELKCKDFLRTCEQDSWFRSDPFSNFGNRWRRSEFPTLEELLNEVKNKTDDVHTVIVGGKDAPARKFKGMCRELAKNCTSKLRFVRDFHITVVNGTDAKSKTFKGMVLLGYGTNKKYVDWNCGGSLISEKHILTAAHCAVSTGGRPKWARVGELDYSNDKDDAKPQDRNVRNWIAHPNYKYPSQYNDIAIAIMDRSVVFTDWVAPMCLHFTKTIPYEKATAIGYGRLGFTSSSSTVLQEVDLTIINGPECRRLFGNEGTATTPNGIDVNSQLCAGEKEGGKDTCIGDSGGPLLLSLPNQCLQTIIGITSFGKECAEANSPGVYTRVYNYLEWIEKTVWPSG